MDKHKRHELCRQTSFYATHAGVRSSDLLYDVQPVCPIVLTDRTEYSTRCVSEPIGEHFVQVCTTTPCMLQGSTEILNTICDTLGGIKPGQTTKDGKFTVIEVECQGACSNAPMMAVGDDFYVRSFPGWNVYSFLIVPPTSGGPHCRDDDKDIGRVLKRTEAKTRSAERSPDERKLGGIYRTHNQGLFRLSLTTLQTPHNLSSLTVQGNSAPRSSVRSLNAHVSSR